MRPLQFDLKTCFSSETYYARIFSFFFAFIEIFKLLLAILPLFILIRPFNFTVCYDSEKSFIGTDFVTAMNHVTENQNQLIRNVSQTYGLSDMNSLIYNSNTTNHYDEFAHQRHMNAAPIGYYKVSQILILIMKQKNI